MVYKRYIKRGEKLCGPYYYESYRDENGKVVSKYLPNYKPPVKITGITKSSEEFLKNKRFLIVLGTILIIFILLVIGHLSYNLRNGKTTGKAVDREAEVTKSQHLDEDRSFINNIYNEVKEKDNNWVLINNNEYARVIFWENLTKGKNITIYARANQSSKIEVYRNGGGNLIAQSGDIINEGWYKIYLENLSENESNGAFDLRTIGAVEFDYIADPGGTCEGTYIICPASAEINNLFNITYGAASQPNPLGSHPWASLSLYKVSLTTDELQCDELGSSGNENPTGDYTKTLAESTIGNKTYQTRCSGCEHGGGCCGFSDSAQSCIVNIVDTTPPQLTINSPLNLTYFNSSIDFKISSNKNLSYCKFSLDNWFTSYTMRMSSSLKEADYAASSVEDGIYTIMFLCSDTFGNINDTVQKSIKIETGANVTVCRALNIANTVYTLQNDLSTTENCLIIGADNITLNGGMHSITGNAGEDDYGINNIGNLINITIKNFGNIGGFSRGISLANISNSLIYNNIMNSESAYHTYAIYIADGNSNIIESNTINWNGTNSRLSYGIYLYVSLEKTAGDNNIIKNDITINSFGMAGGVYLDNSGESNSNVIQDNNLNIDSSIIGSGIYLNNIGKSNSNVIQDNNLNIDSSIESSGIYLDNWGESTNSSVIHNNLNVASAASAPTLRSYGLYLKHIKNLNVSFNIINSRDLSALASDIYFISESSNNILTGNILLGTNYSVYIDINGGINNTFINTSYSGSENVLSGGGLVRKWYYRAHVLDNASAEVANAFVNIFNGLEEAPYIISTTNSTGWTDIINIIEYANKGGIRDYYDDFIIASNQDNTLFDYHIRNVTSEQNNLNDRFTIHLDTTPPVLSRAAWASISGTAIKNIEIIIDWSTDSPSNSSVTYGLTPELELKSVGNNILKVSTHSITLSSLNNNTLHYLNYTSCDFAGNCNTSSINFITPSINKSKVGSAGGLIYCVPDWECLDWTACTGSPGQEIEQKRVCVDNNNCGTNAGKPVETRTCTVSSVSGAQTPKEGDETEPGCDPAWECKEWSECKIVYRLEEIVEGYIFLKGEKSRTCEDKNQCSHSKIERKKCDTKIPVTITKIKGLFKNYIEVRDKNGFLISRLEIIDEPLKKLNIQILIESEYFSYCYNGELDYDEDEIDCVYEAEGSCPLCQEEEPLFSITDSVEMIILLILMSLFILLIIFVDWYSVLLRKSKKEFNKKKARKR